jgi:hemoglobin
MKPDISERADIELLVDTFYTQVLNDPTIGYLFKEVVALRWDTHIPIMYNFWEAVLLGGTAYRGNPMAAHIALHKKSPLTPAHFAQWKLLFFQTLDTHFEGEKVQEAKQRVQAMETLMLYKIKQSDQNTFIQ